MKKILLILICATLAFGSLSARVVKLTMSDYQSTSISDKGFKITAAKASAAQKPAYNEVAGDLRIYARGTLTVESTTSENILGIEFVLSQQGKERLPELTVNAGTANVGNDPTQYAQWSGIEKSIVFTVGTKADYGTKPKESGQLCFLAVKITTDGTGADDDDTPDLTKVYPFTHGRAFYQGISAGQKTPSYLIDIYSDGIRFGNFEGDETLEGTGNYASFDIYTNTPQSLLGTYSTQKGEDVAGGFTSGKISQWHGCGRDVCVSAYIVSGEIRIECAENGGYMLHFDVVDSDGNPHKGSTQNIDFQLFNESGSSHKLMDDCGKPNALSAIEMATQIFGTRGELHINLEQVADVAIYNVLGAKVATLNACESAVLPMASGIYIVRVANQVTKVRVN